MKLSEFLQEDNGGFSSNRLAFLLWVFGVLLVWLIASIKSGSLQEIPDSVETVIGILMTGKVVQKFGEKPSDKQEEELGGTKPANSKQPSIPQQVQSGTPG